MKFKHILFLALVFVAPLSIFGQLNFSTLRKVKKTERIEGIQAADSLGKAVNLKLDTLLYIAGMKVQKTLVALGSISNFKNQIVPVLNGSDTVWYVVDVNGNFAKIGGSNTLVNALVKSDTPTIAFNARRFANFYALFPQNSQIAYFDTQNPNSVVFPLLRWNDYLAAWGTGNFSPILKRSYHGNAFGYGNFVAADSVNTSNGFGTQNFQRAKYVIGSSAMGTDNFAGASPSDSVLYCNGFGFHNLGDFNSTSGSFQNVNVFGTDIGLFAKNILNFVGIGHRTAYNMRNVSSSVFIGDLAGFYQRSGSLCTYIGSSASDGLTQNNIDTLGYQRTAAGYRSLFNRRGDYLTAIGANSGLGNLVAGSVSSSAVFVGEAANAGGSGNGTVYVGSSSGEKINGNNIVAVGSLTTFSLVAKTVNNATFIGANVANAYGNAAWASEDLSNRVIVGNSNNINQPFDANTATGRVKLDKFINLKPQNAPSNPQIGDIYLDATIVKIRFFNGTSWETFASM